MTTVAWDGKTLAADGGMVMDGVKIRFRQKIRRLKKGGLIGFCGEIAAGFLLMDWIEAGHLSAGLAVPEKCEADALWVKKNGEAFLCDTDGVIIKVDDLICAIGSGAPIAYGALQAGASAAEAVRIAIERDPNSGFDVISIDL